MFHAADLEFLDFFIEQNLHKILDIYMVYIALHMQKFSWCCGYAEDAQCSLIQDTCITETQLEIF